MLSTEMLGAPFPAETTITLAGAAWGQGLFSFLPLYATVVLGNVLGSSLSFAVGYYLGRPFVLKVGRIVRLTPQRMEKVEENFERSRPVIILLGKFVSIVRVIVPVLAGINRMNFMIFSAYNTISALVWGAVFLVEGRYLDTFLHHPTLSHASFAAGIVLGLIITVLIIRRLWQR